MCVTYGGECGSEAGAGLLRKKAACGGLDRQEDGKVTTTSVAAKHHLLCSSFSQDVTVFAGFSQYEVLTKNINHDHASSQEQRAPLWSELPIEPRFQYSNMWSTHEDH